jgi:glycosyltransferase involved in cell wall biosynthesis
LQLQQIIWPLIKAHVGKAELHIYGAYPPPKATALHSPRDRFYVRGWTADVHAVMRQARLSLAPLRFGAGLKGKLITAMQAGTPTVTTPIGAEGMHGGMAWGGAIVADPTAFADAAIALYHNEAAWQTAQSNGVAILNRRFNGATYGAHLVDRIRDLRANLAQRRRANFTGAMLRHHTMQSTRYMARWIEAKNRDSLGTRGVDRI